MQVAWKRTFAKGRPSAIFIQPCYGNIIQFLQCNPSLSKKKSSNVYFWLEQRDTKMLDRWICIEGDNPPIGIVLAREKDELQI